MYTINNYDQNDVFLTGFISLFQRYYNTLLRPSTKLIVSLRQITVMNCSQNALTSAYRDGTFSYTSYWEYLDLE